ncbi:hypothetical protein D1092_05825 [Bartonella krasnovii]|uniref:Uncharacterized protein n=1 Tax=Bartonella krasnovii TaxID=2267275 RepID=A0A5B9D2S4_9HYPH|nr:hypothetical protein D1092_05825 [Bartonella krasnovii]
MLFSFNFQLLEFTLFLKREIKNIILKLMVEYVLTTYINRCTVKTLMQDNEFYFRIGCSVLGPRYFPSSVCP